MKEPTIEELASLIFDETDETDRLLPYNHCEVLAKKIHALFHPVRKPMSDGNRCEKELYVEKYFGLPDDINEKTKVDVDFGTLVDLLYGFEYSLKSSAPMKPLSELANSEEDCNKLALALYGHPMISPIRGYIKYGTGNWFSIETGGISTYGANLTIYLDGQIIQSGMYGNVSMFQIVDKIRELGYDISNDAITETT